MCIFNELQNLWWNLPKFFLKSIPAKFQNGFENISWVNVHSSHPSDRGVKIKENAVKFNILLDNKLTAWGPFC